MGLGPDVRARVHTREGWRQPSLAELEGKVICRTGRWFALQTTSQRSYSISTIDGVITSFHRAGIAEFFWEQFR